MQNDDLTILWNEAKQFYIYIILDLLPENEPAIQTTETENRDIQEKEGHKK